MHLRVKVAPRAVSRPIDMSAVHASAGAGDLARPTAAPWMHAALAVSTRVIHRSASHGPDYVRTSGIVLVELEVLGLSIVEVLPGVCGLVLEDLDEAVEADSYEGAEGGSNPVDPVVAGEAAEDNGGAEGAGGVEGA